VTGHCAAPATRLTLMAKKATSHAPARLSAAELGVIERLVEQGRLVAKPQQANAKPRKVIAAALEPDGDRIILWLSAKTTTLGRD
jgi:hypothetical protein